VSDLAQNLRWDIEAELNQLLGPFMASLVISGFKKAQSLGQQLGQKGLAKTKDFLSQDYHVIVQRPVVDALKEDVQSLSQSLHRLEQRIQKLQKV
jgi:ubiquinone biosynthesis protein UbiJ